MALFRRKKNKAKEIDEEIIDEIKKCDNQIVEYEQEIIKIKHHARDLLISILNVPDEYKFEELENYEEIINLPDNQYVTNEEKNELAEICKSYLNHLLIRKEKIKLCSENRKKLQKLLAEVKELNKKLSEEKNKKDLIIEKHKNFVDKLNSSNIETEIENSHKIGLLHEEINNLKNKLQEQKIMTKELKKLLAKYDGLEDLQSVKTLLEELKRLAK